MRIAQETAALLSKADNEREYREHMLVSLTRLEVKVDNLQESLNDHIDQDESKFTHVTQKINEHGGWINKALGMVALLVVMSGVIMWIIDRVTHK